MYIKILVFFNVFMNLPIIFNPYFNSYYFYLLFIYKYIIFLFTYLFICRILHFLSKQNSPNSWIWFCLGYLIGPYISLNSFALQKSLKYWPFWRLNKHRLSLYTEISISVSFSKSLQSQSSHLVQLFSAGLSFMPFLWHMTFMAQKCLQSAVREFSCFIFLFSTFVGNIQRF